MLIAFQTICGFNVGAKAFSRVKESIVVSLKVMTGYALLVTLIVVALPELFVGIFTDDTTLIAVAKRIIHLTLWTFPFAGIIMIATGYYQAVGSAGKAVLFSGLRILAIFVPLVWLLSYTHGQLGIFIAMPIADITASLITVLLCRSEYRKINSNQLQKLEFA
jgi:Na+-driven multidrug efflux pump